MNRLFYGDNLETLRDEIADNSVDLVYLDPPFNSQRGYNVFLRDQEGNEAHAQAQAFLDFWRWSVDTEKVYDRLVAGAYGNPAANAMQALRRLLGTCDMLAYLTMMAPRLAELRRVLKPSGSLYLHCDPTASHYLKILLDAILGPDRFVAEIIWKRTGAHSATNGPGPVHDTLLMYARGREPKWNKVFGAYDPEYVRTKFTQKEPDGRRFQAITLTPAGTRNGATGRSWRGINPTERGYHWKYPPARLDELDAEGRIYWPKKEGGIPRLKFYLDEAPGMPLQDVWTDISPLNSRARERVGYPTQKPVALLQRIIEASTDAGDVVLDPFCGCGTAVDAAQSLDRSWIGIDVSYLAVEIIEQRLIREYGLEIIETFSTDGIPTSTAAAQRLFQKSPFEFERWAVSLVDGIPNDTQVGDRGIDGRIRFQLGGREDTGQVLVQVKGGRNPGPTAVRDLIGTVDSELEAALGLLVTMNPPTAAMRKAANGSGTWTHPVTGHTYPKIQIADVGQLMRGVYPDLPDAITLLDIDPADARAMRRRRARAAQPLLQDVDG